MKPLPAAILAVTLALAPAAAASAAPPIELVAPDTAFATFWCGDVPALIESWRGLPVAKMASDERLKEAFAPVEAAWKAVIDSLGDGDGDRIRELGAPRAIAAAVCTEEDADMDATRMAFLAYADVGEKSPEAWDLAAAWVRARGAANGWTITEETVAGQPAIVAAFPPEPELLGDDGGDEMPGIDPSGMLGQLLLPAEALVVGRSGDLLIFASSVAVAEDVAAAAAHPEAQGHVASRADWKDVAPALERGAIAAAFYLEPLEALLEPFLETELGVIIDINRALFEGATAITATGTLAQGESQVEVDVGVHHPGGCKGVFKLLSEAAPIEEPSRAMGEECLSYGAWRVNIAGVPGLVESMLDALPEELAGEVEGMVGTYMPALKRATRALGPRIESVVREDASALGGTVAFTRIACTDDKAIVPFLQVVAPQLRPTDFQGAQVYADEAPEGFGVGLGQTSLFVGTRAAVESGLRASAAEGGGTLASSELWKRAATIVGNEPCIGISCQDAVGGLEATRSRLETARVLAGAVNEGGAIDPQALSDAFAEALAKADPKAMREFVGPEVATATVTERAHTLRWRLLTP